MSGPHTPLLVSRLALIARVTRLALAPPEKIVLVCLALNSDDRGEACASVVTLGGLSGLRRNVIRATLQDLANRRLLEVAAPATSIRPTTYRLVLEGPGVAQRAGGRRR